ncbi:putative casein kinase 1 [Pisolithus marmoratus]|nr:putative casein kinase 1 [Pisolithus marmoratus]
MNKHKKFHLHTVLYLADQLISCLQYIHSHGYIHGNIKLQNILWGLGNETQIIFIVDFRIARKYHDMKTGNHIPFHCTHSLTGSPAFTSINNHLGAELGHHEDLESLAYLLIYCLCGSLPWLNESSNPCSMSILGLKQKTLVKMLCSRLP